jgi:hypothetical protein
MIYQIDELTKNELYREIIEQLFLINSDYKLATIYDLNSQNFIDKAKNRLRGDHYTQEPLQAIFQVMTNEQKRNFVKE